MRLSLKLVGLTTATLVMAVTVPLLPTSQTLVPVFAQTIQPSKAEAARLLKEGETQLNAGKNEAALSLLEQALKLYQELSDRAGVAQALQSLGTVYLNLQQYEKAISYYQQALPIFQQVKDHEGEAKALNNLGSAQSESPASLCNLPPQFTLIGHLSSVTAIAVNADSKTLVSGDENGVLNIWSLETGQLLRSLAAYPGTIKTVVISPDGRSIVSASSLSKRDTKDEITIKVWNLHNGELIQSLTKQRGIVQTLDSLSDAHTILRISEMGEEYSNRVKIEFLNRSNGNIIQPNSPTANLEKLADTLFSTQDSSQKAAVTVNALGLSFITLWNLRTRHSLCTVPRLGRVQNIIFSPDGQKLIVAGQKIEVIALNSLPVSRERSEQKSKIQHLNSLGLDKLKRKQYYSAAIHFWQVFELNRQMADEQGQADALYNIAAAYYAQCQVGFNSCSFDYKGFYELTLPYWRTNGDRSRQATALYRIGKASEEKDKKIFFFQKALAIYQQLGDIESQRDTLIELGATYATSGEQLRGHQLFSQAVYISQTKNGKTGEYQTLLKLGFFDQALASVRATGDRKAEAWVLSQIGTVGSYEERLKQSLAIYQSLGDRKAEADTLVKIAWMKIGTDEVESLLKQALKLYRAVKDRQGELEVLHGLGISVSGMLTKDDKPIGQRTPEAIRYLQAAATLSREMGDRFLESTILLDLGDVYQLSKQYTQALTSYEQALSIRQSLDDDTGKAIFLYKIAQTQHQLKQYAQAIEELQKTITVCKAVEHCLYIGAYSSEERSSDIFWKLGETYFDLKQYPQALSFFQMLESTSSYSAWNLEKNLGLTYEKLRNYDLALRYFDLILHDVGPGCGAGDTADATIIEAIRDDTDQRNFGCESETNQKSWISALSIATLHSAEIYRRRGQYTQAAAVYKKTLDLYHYHDDIVLNNLGTLYKSQGEYYKALEVYQKSLWIFRQNKDIYGEAVSLNNIGEIYRRQGQYPKALEFYQQSLQIFRELTRSLIAAQAKITPVLDISTTRQGEASVLHNLGGVYYDLGQYGKALDFYQQSLSISKALDDKAAQGRSLNNIGLVYEAQQQYTQALEFYQQALTARREAEDLAGEAGTLNNIGLVHNKLGQPSQGAEPLQQALKVFQKLEDKVSEANTLDSLGTLYTALGQYSQALDSYQNALRLVKEADLPPLEGVILSNIGNLLVKTSQPELAIVFYKQSVNVRETIRTGLHQLPREVQESYTQSVAGTYRALADLLLKQDRILEAQEVLELLKVQEFDNTFKESRGQGQIVTFRKAEAQFLDKFKAQQQGAILAAQELTTLENKPEAQLTSHDRDRITELTQLQVKLADDFIQFINSNQVKILVETLRRKDSGSIDPETLEALRNKFSSQLARLPNTALFYPLILDDRLELILITANANPIRRTVTIDRPTLNQAIADFRLALKNTTQDPKPIAQKLYNLLIQPIADDLQKAKITTLLYSPDRRLRYVPLGALYDSKQWLIERLQISYITAASVTDLTTPRQPQPKVLAGAISDNPGQHYAVDVPPIHREFSGLPNVLPEITGIATQLPNTRELLAQHFTADAIQTLSRQYNILHFATHGSFERQEPELSFILFGGKSRDGKNYATLRDIATWKLDTDLVVLSACETGLADDQFDTKADDSVAVMGLGYKFEQAGARATIASLWVVNDASTSLLMRQFYQNLAAPQSMTKSEALRQAQLSLITKKTMGKTEGDRASSRRYVPGQPAPGDFSHPYYWAPFILIGNSL